MRAATRKKQPSKKVQTSLAHQKRSIHPKNESNLFTDEPSSVYLIYGPAGSWEEVRRENSTTATPESDPIGRFLPAISKSSHYGSNQSLKQEDDDAGSAMQLSSSWTPSLCSQLKKPSKLVVWRLKSQLRFQPLPAALKAPPSIYLFEINVISSPGSTRTEPRRQRRALRSAQSREMMSAEFVKSYRLFASAASWLAGLFSAAMLCSILILWLTSNLPRHLQLI